MRYQIFILIMVLLAGGIVSCQRTTFSRSFIEYRRQGGFLGLDDHLAINENGKAILTRKAERYEFDLDNATINQLISLFESADFSKLHKEYLPAHQGGDLLEYVVIYKGHTVRTMDTAVPAPLQPILELLNQIIENTQKP